MAAIGEESLRFHHKCSGFIRLSDDNKTAESWLIGGSVFSSVALNQIKNRRFVFRVEKVNIGFVNHQLPHASVSGLSRNIKYIIFLLSTSFNFAHLFCPTRPPEIQSLEIKRKVPEYKAKIPHEL